jgi:hypothetical protein
MLKELFTLILLLTNRSLALYYQIQAIFLSSIFSSARIFFHWTRSFLSRAICICLLFKANKQIKVFLLFYIIPLHEHILFMIHVRFTLDRFMHAILVVAMHFSLSLSLCSLNHELN